jgi:hypothetical protein
MGLTNMISMAPRVCPVRNNPERNNPERNDPERNNPERNNPETSNNTQIPNVSNNPEAKLGEARKAFLPSPSLAGEALPEG